MKKKFSLILLFLFIFPTLSCASEVGVTWEANTPEPEGYKVFQRCGEGSTFDYENPVWVGPETFTGPIIVEDGVKCYYEVRAFQGDVESISSMEVSFYRPTAPKNPIVKLWAIIKKLLGI